MIHFYSWNLVVFVDTFSMTKRGRVELSSLCCFILFQPRQCQPWWVAPACWCTSAGPQNPGIAFASAGVRKVRDTMWRRKVVWVFHGSLSKDPKGWCSGRFNQMLLVFVAVVKVQLIRQHRDQLYDQFWRHAAQPREGDLEKSWMGGFLKGY